MEANANTPQEPKMVAVVEPAPSAADAQQKNPSILSTILAIVGILIVAIVIIWGLAHLISLSSPWVSSLFRGSPAAQVESNTTASTQPGMIATTTLAKAPQPAARAASYSSPANLTVRIVSATIDGYGRGTFVFDISNTGGSPTGAYTFEAFLPTTNYGGSSYTYYSPVQRSLLPGAHITSTLTFSQAVPGIASVLVDPSGRVRESSKTDNYASQSLVAPYYTPQPYGY